jgi:ABC-2 type transport system permease protein
MLNDIWTVMRKEWKEMVLQRPNLRGGWVGLLVLLGVFGIFIPLQSGREWVTSPVNMALWAWVPFILVSAVVADSFAGERERHTLETLLASRLSDQVILLGKIGASMIYGWVLTVGSLVLGLVTVNIVHGKGQLLLYPLGLGLGILVLILIVSTFSAALGVLVSLRAASVRQAQQSFNVAILAFMIPLFLFPLLPEDLKIRVTQGFSGINSYVLFIGILLILSFVDAGLLALTVVRFQRPRLILDL